MLSWIIIREQIMTVGRHNVNHHKAWKLSIRLGREGDQPEDASTGGAKTSLIYKPLWPWGSIQTLRMRPFSTLSAEYCPVSGGKVWPEGNEKEAETLCTFLQYIPGYLHFKGRLKIRGKKSRSKGNGLQRLFSIHQCLYSWLQKLPSLRVAHVSAEENRRISESFLYAACKET